MNINITKLSRTDAIVAIYILVAFLMFIIPLPSWLLDIFMAFNIAIAFTVLYVCLLRKCWICPISPQSCSSPPYSVSP